MIIRSQLVFILWSGYYEPSTGQGLLCQKVHYSLTEWKTHSLPLCDLWGKGLLSRWVVCARLPGEVLNYFREQAALQKPASASKVLLWEQSGYPGDEAMQQERLMAKASWTRFISGQARNLTLSYHWSERQSAFCQLMCRDSTSQWGFRACPVLCKNEENKNKCAHAFALVSTFMKTFCKLIQEISTSGYLGKGWELNRWGLMGERVFSLNHYFLTIHCLFKN